MEAASGVAGTSGSRAVKEATAGHRRVVDDGLLVRRCQEGDVGAFEILYRTHVARIHALCVRLTGATALGEELTQEVFVRAWRRLGSFRAESALATWLHRLAVNVFLDRQRGHRARAEGRALDGLDVLDRPAPSRDPAASMDLERAIAALPDGARAVFVLHDVEGWEHAEIAAMTGIAVGTSKAQLHRARRLLREALRP
jgi:RNA polymerase sigma-70 factor (ECF subfamily)